MLGLGGTTSYKTSTSGQYKYQSIPAEIDEADPENNNRKESRHVALRTPFQNCVMFSLPLVFLMIVALILVSVSSGDREKSIMNHANSKKGGKGDDSNTCVSCPATIMSGSCYSTDTAVLGGLDFVDYFDHTEDGSNGQSYQAGISTYSSVYKGYSFQFISKENQAKFETSPETYVPQFGGFCAWGVAGEYCPSYPWSADCLGPIGAWNFGYKYNGKLYFFYDQGAVDSFFTNPDYYVKLGNERWESWYGNTRTLINTNCYLSS